MKNKKDESKKHEMKKGDKREDKFDVPVKKGGKVVGFAVKSGAKNVQRLLNKKK